MLETVNPVQTNGRSSVRLAHGSIRFSATSVDSQPLRGLVPSGGHLSDLCPDHLVGVVGCTLARTL